VIDRVKALVLIKASRKAWVFELPSGDVVVECRVCGWSMLIDSPNKEDAMRHFRKHWEKTHSNGSKRDVE